MLAREDADVRTALNDHDKYLEVVASRSSALCTCYSIFLAVLALVIPAIHFNLIKIIMAFCAAVSLLSVLMLFPCLWIYWQKSADTYQTVHDEFEKTTALLYFRSTLFNASMALATTAILAAAFLFLLDRFLQPVMTAVSGGQ